MASIIRLNHLPVMQRCVWNHFNKVSRTISTSRKNSDSAATTTAAAGAAATPSNKNEENWVSYGFDYNSQKDDTNYNHASFFFSVTLCLVFGGFAWAYAPDTLSRDWAQREAFLELRRREKAGLPPIDPNYVDPKTVKLPADSTICDVEIII